MPKLFEVRRPGGTQRIFVANPKVVGRVDGVFITPNEKEELQKGDTANWKAKFSGSVLDYMRGTGVHDKEATRTAVTKALAKTPAASRLGHGPHVPRELKNDVSGYFRQKAKSWEDLGIKPIANVGAKKVVTGKEALQHPGAPQVHTGNVGQIAPEAPEMSTSMGLKKGLVRDVKSNPQYDKSPVNAEISLEVCPECNHPLGKHGWLYMEHPHGDIVHPVTGKKALRVVGHGPKSVAAAKEQRKQPLAGKPHQKTTAHEVGWSSALKQGSNKTSFAAQKGANIEGPGHREHPEKKEIKSSRDPISAGLLLIEYVLAKLGKEGWIPYKGKKKPPDEEGPTPHGPPGRARPIVMGFKKGPHYTQSGGEKTSPHSLERAKAEFETLFKREEYMNPTKIANDIIREAFTIKEDFDTGDRNNTTKGSGKGMPDKGGVARLMLSGEFVGSSAWPFDQSVSSDFEGSAKLQASQAVSGQGEGTSTAPTMAEVAKGIVDGLLEDTPSSIYTDPESVGYFLRSLVEAGYPEFAARCSEICENYTEEMVVEVSKMAEKLEADKADPYLIEGLQDFAALIISESEGESTPTLEAGETEPTGEDQPKETSPTPEKSAT